MDKKQIVDRVNELESILNSLRREKIHLKDTAGLKNSESFFLLLLSSLNDGQPVTPSEAADKLGVTMAAVTHHINSLEKQGFVARTLSVDDRRVWYISLTKTGKEKILIIKKNHRNKLNQLVDYLGNEDSAKLVQILDKISKYIKTKKESDAEIA